ncbi:hypothetical protein [Rickettsia akari]|uniref:hypothetical protein n=1 Tax=Rickettsia akari TaxID=786 RepID=UPI0012FAF3D0|nr:hypothetical protein [Rickettsia akari]
MKTQSLVYLDSDFINIDFFKELFLIDEEKLQESIKRLEPLPIVNVICQNGQNNLQLHRLVQISIKNYISDNLDHIINKKEIHAKLIEALDDLLPQLTNIPNEDLNSAKILYPHVIKILNYNIEIDKFRKANLYQKIGCYQDYILYKFEESLKYHKETFKIYKV